MLGQLKRMSLKVWFFQLLVMHVIFDAKQRQARQLPLDPALLCWNLWRLKVSGFIGKDFNLVPILPRPFSDKYIKLGRVTWFCYDTNLKPLHFQSQIFLEQSNYWDNSSYGSIAWVYYASGNVLKSGCPFQHCRKLTKNLILGNGNYPSEKLLLAECFVAEHLYVVRFPNLV